MSDNEKLLPCPFCGGEARIEPWHGGGPDKHLASCDEESCPASPSTCEETRADTITAWNTRTALSTPCVEQDADEVERIAKIIDPDAWHETLPTDGLGAYWIGRRNNARNKARAAISAIQNRQPNTDEVERVARLLSPEAWERREHFQRILRGEGKLPTDPEEIAMYKRSAARRVDTVVAPSLEKARAALSAIQSRDDGLREAALHLLDVGEFCRTDDTESALRGLRAALQMGGEKP